MQLSRREEFLKEIIGAIVPGVSTTEDIQNLFVRLGLDTDLVYYGLCRPDLLAFNAVIKVAGNYFLLRHHWNPKQKRQRRSRKDVHNIFEANQFEGTNTPTDKEIGNQTLIQAIKNLTPRKDKSAAGKNICRGNLFKIAAQLNDALADLDPLKENDDRPFKFQDGRSQIIAALINWRFKYRERIDATYSSREITELLTNENRKHLGET